MRDATLVEEAQRIGHRRSDHAQLIHRRFHTEVRHLDESLLERAVRGEVHHQVRPTVVGLGDVSDLHDPRIVQRAQQPRLLHEATAHLGFPRPPVAEQLDGDRDVEAFVVRQVHGGEVSRSQALANDVPTVAERPRLTRGQDRIVARATAVVVFGRP